MPIVRRPAQRRTVPCISSGEVAHRAAKAGKLGACSPPATVKETILAKPNYSFEKRQRELAKKKKQEQKLEQKRLLKQPKNPADGSESVDSTSGDPPAPTDTGTAP